MRTALALCLGAVVASGVAGAQDVVGEWHGSIEIENDAPLRLALHVARGPGGLTATIDSMDEGGMDLALDSISVSGAAVKFEMKSVSGSYQGKVATDGSAIVGSWSQNGTDWPLIWHRGEDPGVVSRPLDPEEARRQGRVYTQWFYEGKAAELWARLSPVMRQSLRNPENLDEFCRRVLGAIGNENRLAQETVSLCGALQTYRRVAKSDRSENVQITFAFDSNGAIAQFEVRAGGRPL